MTNATEIDRPRNRAWSVLATALTVLLLGLLLAAVARADERGERLDRKLKVMERVLDEILVQSPNVIASGPGATRSLRLDGEGVLFVVAADLVAGRERVRFGEWFVPMPAPAAAPLPPVAAPAPDAADAEREQAAAMARQAAEEARQEMELHRQQVEAEMQEALRRSRETREAAHERLAESSRENLEGIALELREALVDYGGTLAELGDGQWLAVALFLGDRSYLGFGDDERSTLLVRARVDDLRRYNAGDLSRDEAVAMVTVDER